MCYSHRRFAGSARARDIGYSMPSSMARAVGWGALCAVADRIQTSECLPHGRVVPGCGVAGGARGRNSTTTVRRARLGIARDHRHAGHRLRTGDGGCNACRVRQALARPAACVRSGDKGQRMHAGHAGCHGTATAGRTGDCVGILQSTEAGHRVDHQPSFSDVSAPPLLIRTH